MLSNLKIIFVLLLAFEAGAQLNTSLVQMEAQAYVGKYLIEHQNFSAHGIIRFANGSLYFQSEGITEVKLVQLPNPEHFKSEKFEVAIYFIRNDFKEIIEAKIVFQGQEFLAKKISF